MLNRTRRNPRALDRTVNLAIREWRPRGEAPPEDRTRAAIARATARIQRAYEGFRRTTSVLIPFAMIDRLRVRAARLRATVMPSFAAGTAGCMETLNSLVAAVVFTAMLAGAAGAEAAPAPLHVSEQATRRVAHVAPDAATAGRPGASGRVAATIGASLSSDSWVAGGPASAEAKAGVRGDDRIEFGRDVSVTVLGEEYYRHEGTVFWMSCDPESTVKQVLCSAYREFEASSGSSSL